MITEAINFLFHGMSPASIFFTLGGTVINVIAIYGYLPSRDLASSPVGQAKEAFMTSRVAWSELLIDAVKQPGKIMRAYTAFYGQYSIGNSLLALFQCLHRGLTPGPLATFARWKELGRHVKKGEKALTLCMPVTAKKKLINAETDEEQDQFRTFFVYRNNWFVLAQTEGSQFQLSSPWIRSRQGAEVSEYQVD